MDGIITSHRFSARREINTDINLRLDITIKISITLNIVISRFTHFFVLLYIFPVANRSRVLEEYTYTSYVNQYSQLIVVTSTCSLQFPVVINLTQV